MKGLRVYVVIANRYRGGSLPDPDQLLTVDLPVIKSGPHPSTLGDSNLRPQAELDEPWPDEISIRSAYINLASRWSSVQ